jgi:hypothetical protein
MSVLNRKQKNRLGRAVSALCKPKAYLPPNAVSPEIMREQFGREIKLANGVWLYPNEVGRAHFQDIVSSIDEARIFEGRARYSDIWSALEATICDALMAPTTLSDTDDLLTKIGARISESVRPRTYVVCVQGVDLKGH